MGIEILLLSLQLVFAQGTSDSLFPNWKSSWIEGGTYAAPGEFPYMVSVRNRKPTRWDYCGGSIINNWYILTAAHCVFGATTPKVKVVIGINELYRGGQTLDVSRITAHHSFDASTQNNDIALLRVMRPLVYSSTVQPVRLPNQGEKSAKGVECILTGWGYSSSSETSLQNHLQKLQLKTVSNAKCQKYYQFMSDTKICATASPGRGVCIGDTGGPLVCGGKQMGVLIGGTTQNTKCTASLPSTYVYVSKYIDWIRNHAL